MITGVEGDACFTAGHLAAIYIGHPRSVITAANGLAPPVLAEGVDTGLAGRGDDAVGPLFPMRSRSD